MTHGIFRSVELYQQPQKLYEIRQRMMKLDFSWQASVKIYLKLYEDMHKEAGA
jgi:starch synthase